MRHVRDGFGGQSAAVGAERGDVVQQAVLGFRRQITEQTLGDPGGGPVAVETRVAQGGRPVVSQVDGYGAQLSRRGGAQTRQSGGLELDDRWLVDLRSE